MDKKRIIILNFIFKLMLTKYSFNFDFYAFYARFKRIIFSISWQIQ